MSRFVTFGIGAVAVVALLLIGSQLLRAPNVSPGSGSSPTPPPSPTETSQPSPSATAAPPLTQSFTSRLHGISVSYPQGWIARAATQPWTHDTFENEFLANKAADVLYDPTLTDHLFLAFASQPIGDATPEDWVARQLMSGEGCSAPEPVTVDGATGLIGTGECNVAAVTVGGRGYWLQILTSNDEPWIGETFDRAWFVQFLAQVQLNPKAAVD